MFKHLNTSLKDTFIFDGLSDLELSCMCAWRLLRIIILNTFTHGLLLVKLDVCHILDWLVDLVFFRSAWLSVRYSFNRLSIDVLVLVSMVLSLIPA